MYRFFKFAAYLFYFLLLFIQTAAAQGKLVQNNKFRNLNIEDGLSQNYIRDIFQDKYGFIWVATVNGLNRFDGYTFEKYVNEPDNINSLINNNIFDIEGDTAGNLVIATIRGGLDVFDPVSNRFYHFKHDEKIDSSILSDEIVSLYFSSNDKLWGGTRYGLFEVDVASKPQCSFSNFQWSQDSAMIKYAYEIIETANKNLWFASRDGLFFKKKDDSKINRIFPTKDHSFQHFFDFLKIGKQTLWVTYESSKILDISAMKNDPFTAKFFDLTDSLGLNGVDEIKDMLLSHEDLWIATSNGLFQYPGFQIGKPFPKPIIHRKGEGAVSLSNNDVQCLYEDREKNIWIGTKNGLNLYHQDYQFFNHLTFQPSHPSVQMIEEFRSFMTDRNNYLWTCTDYGVHIFKKESTGWKEIKRFPIADFKAKEAVQITEAFNGTVWLAAYGSLSRIDHNGYKIFDIKSYKYNEGVRKSTSTERLFRIEPGADGKIYLAGYYGILSFDPEEEKFKVFPTPEPNYLINLIFDDEKNLWYVGSQLGVMIFEPQKNSLKYLLTNDGKKILDNDRIKSMAKEGDSLLWIGGGNGLHKINLISKTRKTYHLNDGLKDVVIGNIFPDSYGNIWTTNSQGIDVLNRESDQFTHFGLLDGLQGATHGTRTVFKDDEGNIWLAGLQGINCFNPDSIFVFKPEADGRFTSIQINNQHDETIPSAKLFSKLETAPFVVDRLKLNHKDLWLALSYSALHFTHPEKIIYEYRLKPNDEDWKQMIAGQPITYTNLPPGNHDLLIRFRDNIQTFKKTKILNIVKKPAPWKSTGAYIIYALTFGFLIWTWIKNKEKQIKRENMLIEVERESFRKRSARDFHDEAGHHITKISILSELVNRNTEGHAQLNQFATQISETVQKLRGGMRDFIWVLDPENDNLYNTVARIKETGNQLFEHQGASFQCSVYHDSWKQINLSSEQRRHLLFIFKEAMNNILKYAKAKSINFNVSQENKQIVLSIQDDGIGFEQNAKSQGYGLKNMQLRAKKIDAEFNLHSTLGTGSEISVAFSTSM